MDLFSGTSGFSYKEWKGNFYPQNLPNDAMLSFYAQRLPSVELNNTFYRMPRIEVLENWRDQVSDDFRFSVKASKRITHIKRINNCEEETEYLLSKLATLRDRLGAILFQLPPNLKKDLERLKWFCELLPENTPAAFEFRHQSWFDEEIYDLLRDRNFAWCTADGDETANDSLNHYCRLGLLEIEENTLFKNRPQRLGN